MKDDEIVEQLMESKPGNFDILINAPGLNRMKLLTGAIKDINVSTIFVRSFFFVLIYSFPDYPSLISISDSGFLKQEFRLVVHDF